MGKGTLFLTLRTFSATGGIEKVTRQMGKALYDLEHDEQSKLDVFSMYDKSDEVDERYFPARVFKGFGQNKIGFMLQAFFAGMKKKRVIISHINLLLPALVIKFFAPQVKLLVLAHGIEVWDPMPGWKRRLLAKCDRFLPVSSFTKEKMLSVQGLSAEKFEVLNNCLDPFMTRPVPAGKNAELLGRYNFTHKDKVLMTLTRLSSKEKYKGYDNVLHCMAKLKQKYPDLKYLIVGNCDADEKERLADIISRLGLGKDVVLSGFIPDEEIAAHFALADVYIMPSKKEGFGLVFIEAMFHGKPVIAGNKDGSVDALCTGELGLLVDPDSLEEISFAIDSILTQPGHFMPDHAAVLKKFSFETYKKRLEEILKLV